MKIIDLKESEYIEEYIKLCSLEWGSKKNKEEMQAYIDKKKRDIYNGEKYICALGLIDNEELIGFISLFKEDGKKRKDLSPWYATMYVKEKYRNMGYSKVLNSALLEKAKELNYKKVYLKTQLNNYYEKFGAKYIEDLGNGEKLYYIDLINNIDKK